jgi:hypothetical protein
MKTHRSLESLSTLLLFGLLVTGCSQQNDATRIVSPEDIYHHHSELGGSGGSNDIEVRTSKDGEYAIKSLGEDSHVATKMTMDGRILGTYPDALGSKNIRIAIDKEVGYTQIAGLKFPQAAVINIWNDGVVEVDKEGVEASDKNSTIWVSKRARLGEKEATVMIRKR